MPFFSNMGHRHFSLTAWAALYHRDMPQLHEPEEPVLGLPGSLPEVTYLKWNCD